MKKISYRTSNNETFHYTSKNFLVPGENKKANMFSIIGPEFIDLAKAADISLITKEISDLLKLNKSTKNKKYGLFYEDGTSNICYKNNFLSHAYDEELYFLRGWKEFSSCIKGFNVIGLIAEQIYYFDSSDEYKNKVFKSNLIHSYLKSRKISGIALSKIINTKISSDLLLAAKLSFLFGNKTIVCSTSTNMGISLHEFIGLLRNSLIAIKGVEFSIFNDTEGKLIIWAPDRRADFMSAEKADQLQSLELEKNSTTKIKTYLDRRERDPGALLDAIKLGGYFFPTNPQSKLELAELLKKTFNLKTNLFNNSKSILAFLKTLGVSFNKEENIYEISRGIEGGIYGLMLPIFFNMNDINFLKHIQDGADIEFWNQASIGAALAGACLAVYIVKNTDEIKDIKVINKFHKNFPNIKNIKNINKINISVKGTFDIANLQSLAQLLGVIVEKHLSGKGVPYVGLGSSSYSNGNLCYDILNACKNSKYIFNGSKDFYPATHLLNVIAQAIIYSAEAKDSIETIKNKDKKVSNYSSIMRNYKVKPENAGSASFTGFLLNQLDTEVINVVFIVRLLKKSGYSFEKLCEFISYSDINNINNLRELAISEGPYMRQLLEDIESLLDQPMWLIDKIEDESSITSKHNKNKIRVFYLTGDNTTQPPISFIKNLNYAK